MPENEKSQLQEEVSRVSFVFFRLWLCSRINPWRLQGWYLSEEDSLFILYGLLNIDKDEEAYKSAEVKQCCFKWYMTCTVLWVCCSELMLLSERVFCLQTPLEHGTYSLWSCWNMEASSLTYICFIVEYVNFRWVVGKRASDAGGFLPVI